MLDNYEKFKKDVYVLTKIDLNCYKEKQMRRRIDTLINKNGITSYDAYVDLIKKDKEKFEQFVNFLTINVSEFYRNPEQILTSRFWIKQEWDSTMRRVLRMFRRI